MAFRGPPGVPGSTTHSTCWCVECPSNCTCDCFQCRPREAPPVAPFEAPNPDPVDMHTNFACFYCKKVVKKVYKGGMDSVVWGDLLTSHGQPSPANVDDKGQPKLSEYGGYGAHGKSYTEKCGNCSEPMIMVGPSFEVPKQSDDKAWAQKATLARAGYMFTMCKCVVDRNAHTLAALGVSHPSEVKGVPVHPPGKEKSSNKGKGKGKGK
eukprot:GFYU01000658.1.p1 GENE.GFYU01000658.1~~GFYU01000658.1.p1  ORF type:complete len:209 (+),score=37.96 GFYU01000658.1:144-770(+)